MTWWRKVLGLPEPADVYQEEHAPEEPEPAHFFWPDEPPELASVPVDQPEGEPEHEAEVPEDEPDAGIEEPEEGDPEEAEEDEQLHVIALVSGKVRQGVLREQKKLGGKKYETEQVLVEDSTGLPWPITEAELELAVFGVPPERPQDERVRFDLTLTRGEWELWGRAAGVAGVETDEFIREVANNTAEQLLAADYATAE